MDGWGDCCSRTFLAQWLGSKTASYLFSLSILRLIIQHFKKLIKHPQWARSCLVLRIQGGGRRDAGWMWESVWVKSQTQQCLREADTKNRGRTTALQLARGCQESFPEGLMFRRSWPSWKKGGDVPSILMIKQANPRKSSWVQMLA